MDTSPLPFSPLARVRSATHPLHERVDRAASTFPASSEGLRRFLATLATVVVPLESALREVSFPAPLMVKERWCKTAWLAEDLGGVETIPKSGFSDLSGGRAWGAMYVLEGSTLGGPIVLKTKWPDFRSRYLTGYNGMQGAMWKEFTAEFERSVSPELTDDVVAGAIATFERFEEALLRNHD